MDTQETAPKALKTYVFLGSHSAISGPGYDHTLTKFGEEVTLPEEQGINHAIHGAVLVPKENLTEIGFTPEELEQNSDLPAHDLTADEAFLQKRKLALMAADEFRRNCIEASKK